MNNRKLLSLIKYLISDNSSKNWQLPVLREVETNSPYVSVLDFSLLSTQNLLVNNAICKALEIEDLNVFEFLFSDCWSDIDITKVGLSQRAIYLIEGGEDLSITKNHPYRKINENKIYEY